MPELLELFLPLAFALATGLLLGAVFFAGLWWTVRQYTGSPAVAFWFLASMLLRTGFVLAGFYFLLGDSWNTLVAGLCGFVIARMIVMRFTRSTPALNPAREKAGYES